MKEIDLLEKLVAVQEQHIELMNDFANLQGSLKSLEEVKNKRIQDLNVQIEYQDEKILALDKENKDLKKQIEILQQSIISVETPEENQ